MKVHIIGDMEGVAGIVKWQQTSGGDPMYDEGRRLYTEEINAAVRGAKSAGETGINAALCGTWNTPVLLVTGDGATCEEARELLGDGLTTVAVKQGLGRYSARQIPPLRARDLIEEGAKRALQDL